MLINTFIISLLISFSSLASSTANPQATMKTYLSAMVAIKKNEGNKSENYQKAISTFKFGKEINIDNGLKKRNADLLMKVIDKIAKVEIDKIPTETTKNIWYFDQRTVKERRLEISIGKFDDEWYFTPETFYSLETYKVHLRNTKNIAGVIELSSLADLLKEKMPYSMQEKSFILENWQWPGIVILLILSFIAELISYYLIHFLVKHYSLISKSNSSQHLEKAITPFSKLVFLFTLNTTFPLLELPIEVNSIINRILIIGMSFVFVWISHRLIELMGYLLVQKSLKTESRFDDILVPLITKTAFIVVYLIGLLIVLKSFTVDVTSLIAGLGIGGLAFAFAAKDTLANFFGSIMLVLDRPFDIGDIINAGDIEGTVEVVGFRSTRIRTFDDSMISISNGELMNRSINNLGKRRFRRLSTTLGVEYSTPPEKIEAFCEGIRQLIVNHRWTKKDSFHVYFVNFGASSLDIQMKVSWDTSDYARELAERHRLMIDNEVGAL